MYRGLLHKYRPFLSLGEDSPIISLCEGNTPLIRAHHLEERVPGLEVYLKYDGLNPTGSFKDRGMTMAVTKAVEEGSKAIICASTGNTSASAAAYAAKAGIRAIVIIQEGKIAMGKMAQAIAYGAEIISIDGNFDDALEIVKELSEKLPMTLVNSINPYRIEGQQTSAFEICDDLGEAPDVLVIPVGNAGNITAYWKGFQAYREAGKITRTPKLFGFQASGAAPIVDGAPVAHPETVATAIRIGNPASWQLATDALEASGGAIDKITDEKILEGYQMLAACEGVFAEPASAITVAGLVKAYDEGKFEEGQKVVLVLTGNGLKDPDTAVGLGGQIRNMSADREAIADHLEALLR